MKQLLLIFSCLQVFQAAAQLDTSGPIDYRCLRAVVQIEKDSATGTGFLIRDGERLFLVTNKHMIGKWSPVDTFILADSITTSLYTSDPSHPIYKMKINLKQNGRRASKVLPHPNSKIDVAIVEVTNESTSTQIEGTIFIDRNLLITLRQADSFLSYGSHVFALGFPAGIKSFRTNQPIAKSGFLASAMDENLVVQQYWKNRNGRLIPVLSEGKIFLIDGLIIPGNSGGPVISSQSVEWREINGQIVHLQNTRNRILGIVSNSFSSTGITTVFATDNILELLDLYKSKRRDEK